MTLLVSFALVLIFLVGTVGAAEVDDVDVDNSTDSVVGAVSEDVDLDNSTDSVVGAVSEEENLSATQDDALGASLQQASFDKVSKVEYLVGNTFSVKIMDAKGIGIANKTVIFNANNKISKVLTNEKGVAKLVLNFTKGKYTVKYKFNETGYTLARGSNSILLLSKGISTITAKNAKCHAGLKYTYKILLKADGIPLSNRNVKVTFKGKTYNRKTDSNGYATLPIYVAKGKYTIKISYAGKGIIKASSKSYKITVSIKKNPYGTRSTVIIDADGGFTKSFLNDVAKRLRMAGWKVIVKGIGPGQHSINYKLAKNCVYMPFYNGMCAGTIKEMAAGYYGGVLKKNKAVLAPAWYTKEWTNPDGMLPYRYDITGMKFLKRAWDDNFSPSGFKGIKNPAQFMTNNGIKYCVGDTSYMIVEQFLQGGWVATH